MLELITGGRRRRRQSGARWMSWPGKGRARMIEVALQLEVESTSAAIAGERDAAGHAVVVRNGTARPRRVTTARADSGGGRLA